MDPDRWLEDLSARLAALGDDAEAPVTRISAEERAALLDLARIAAHSSARWTAPLSTYLAGVAVGGLPASERAAALRALVATLPDPDDPDEDGTG